MPTILTDRSRRGITYFIQHSAPNTWFSVEKYKRRKEISADEAEALFTNYWNSGLCNAIDDETIYEYDQVINRLQEFERDYCKPDRTHKIVTYKNQQFVVQLKRIDAETLELEQIWFVESRDHNPLNICITFPSIASKMRFESLAKQHGYKWGKQLAEHIAKTYMNENNVSWED